MAVVSVVSVLLLASPFAVSRLIADPQPPPKRAAMPNPDAFLNYRSLAMAYGEVARDAGRVTIVSEEESPIYMRSVGGSSKTLQGIRIRLRDQSGSFDALF